MYIASRASTSLPAGEDGTTYIVVTNDLPWRVWEHQNDLAEGFPRRYGVRTLVCTESHGGILSAIQREKQLKKRKRAWKISLIENRNPTCGTPIREVL